MNASYARDLSDAPSSFAEARAFSVEVEQSLSASEMMKTSHAEVEAFVEKSGREWARLVLQEHLVLRAEREREVDVVGADDVERTRTRESARQLETVVGTVTVLRKAYRATGCPDLHPLDATLNLPHELFSHGVRKVVAKEAARASFEEVVELLGDYSGAHVAKRQVEELAVRAAEDFDAFYELRGRERYATGDLLVLSTDAKGIVMRREDLREATRRAAENSAHKLETRLTPGEKSNRKRMAQVATVYSVKPWVRTIREVLHSLRDEDTDNNRPKPNNKRVWASVQKHPRELIRTMFEDADRRDPEHRRRWVVLVDGEPKQLKAVKKEARRLGVKITIILDVVHVLEYIWLAARALFGQSSPEAEEWVEHRFLSLLSGRSGGDVARTIRYWAEKRSEKLDKKDRKRIRKACGYLSDRTRTRLMQYKEALRDGLPIATGVIEGACRYLVKDRMDRTGACWSLVGAEAVLRLRALRASGDFDAYWEFHLEREKERTHAARYAGGEIPDPLPVRKCHLRRIK